VEKNGINLVMKQLRDPKLLLIIELLKKMQKFVQAVVTLSLLLKNVLFFKASNGINHVMKPLKALKP